MQNSKPSVSSIESSFALPLRENRVAVAQSQGELGRTFRFQFQGNAREYFGIWIVNILLTLLTLSLYAPWAKVRRLRYFYGNTVFYGRRFDFTGVPTRILMGRLIALGLYLGTTVLAQLSWKAAFAGFVMLFLLIPWLIRSTFRFRARNSKFANSRFYFTGRSQEAYFLALKGLLIHVFTLGLFFPVLFWYFKKYTFDHLKLGQLGFKLHADWPAYMRAMYIPIFLFAATLTLLIIGAIFLLHIGMNSPAQFGMLIVITYLLAAFMVWPLMMARTFITTWNQVSLGQSTFQTDCSQWRYAWIVMSNWMLKLLSLGLLSAWAAIRLYRYQIQSLSLTLRDDPDQLYALAQDDPNAIAEELSDIFDLDLSL